MTDGLDMAEHITHRELQDAIAPLATKRELEIWSGALIGRMDAQFETLQLHLDAMQRNMEAMQQDMRREMRRDMRRDMRREIDAMRSELQLDIARHTSAIFESTQAMIRALDESPADLPVGSAGARRPARDVESR